MAPRTTPRTEEISGPSGGSPGESGGRRCVQPFVSAVPRFASPLNLMQEAYRSDPWALLVGCILFNMVRGDKARPVLEEFLRRWPTPESIGQNGTPWSDLIEMMKLFEPLGLQRVRADRIILMTIGWVTRGIRSDHSRVGELYGIGKYGQDSFRIFCLGELVEDVKDKELKKYVKWAKSQGGDRREPPAGQSPGP